MTVEASREVEATLLLLAETRERAERAWRAVASGDGSEQAAEALQHVDRELLALHRRLMDETVFHVADAESQLALDAA